MDRVKICLNPCKKLEFKNKNKKSVRRAHYILLPIKDDKKKLIRLSLQKKKKKKDVKPFIDGTAVLDILTQIHHTVFLLNKLFNHYFL